MLGKLFKIFQPSDEQKGVEAGSYKYCPRCGDEFRADFMKCTVCNVALEKEKPGTQKDVFNEQLKKPERSKIKPGEKVVSIQQGPLVEIKRLKNLLENAGVPSLIYAETPGRGGG